ncbi:hypothetical protein TPY_1398 [Sulfobacillus acidophilus TPY]|nr:hypothetical protein TPY_1398 [Sulfobacillus acidophilus TPY]
MAFAYRPSGGFMALNLFVSGQFLNGVAPEAWRECPLYEELLQKKGRFICSSSE